MSALKRQVTISEGEGDVSTSTKKLRPTKRKAVDSTVATMSQVRKAIAAARETKISTLSQNAINVTDNIQAASSWPEPDIGTRNDQRVGNIINPTSMELRYIIHNTSTSNNFMVRVITVQSKQGSALSNTEVISNLFEDASGATVPPATNLDAMMQRVNSELFIVKDDIVHKLGYNGSGAAQSSNIVRRKTFKPVSTLKFEEGSSNTPVANKYVTIMIPRLSTNQSPGTESVEFTNEKRMMYKD